MAREWLLSQNRIGRKFFAQAHKAVMGRTHGHYPAPLQALEVIQLGLDMEWSKGLTQSPSIWRAGYEPGRAPADLHIYATQALKKEHGGR